ncbi:hypothetical protein Celaphus_00010417 [Cervus elaphus hippelaphus]|uniref:Uncharacterized protein n=1 Tax=Cervus elaphus hippelaphus TaxID=46360 RepID=A0A212C9V2_CEREH|nr:hypothetical protein Celaphus_00010417 [Cervus elaphus hippelaphus]
MEYEKTQTVLSELKLKFEMTEQEKQSITDELKQCKDNLKLLREKGNNVSLCKRGLALIERQARALNLPYYNPSQPYSSAYSWLSCFGVSVHCGRERYKHCC